MYACNIRFQRNVTLLCGRMEARRCGARRRRGGRRQCMELVGAAAARTTCRRGGVTQSSSPRLLAGASVVEAAALSEQHGRGGRVERAARSRRPQRVGSVVEVAALRAMQVSGAVEKKHNREIVFFVRGADKSRRTWGSEWGSRVCPSGCPHRALG